MPVMLMNPSPPSSLMTQASGDRMCVPLLSVLNGAHGCRRVCAREVARYRKSGRAGLHHAVAAVALGGVERGIGDTHQRRQIEWSGCHRDAHTDSDRQRRLAIEEGGLTAGT